MLTQQILSFTDSEVAAVRAVGGNIQILFSAAHVFRDDPAAFSKPVEGFARGVALILLGAKPNQNTGELIGRILSGRVLTKGLWSPQISLPCTLHGPIKLEITFANQSHLEIEAEGLECRFEGEPNFFESMAC